MPRNDLGYGLALHTSSRELGLALALGPQLLRHQSWNLDRALSNYLHSHLQDFMQPQTWQELSYLAVAQGPGSFTSTRIGLVTARTLGQQLDLPVFAFSSLLTYAQSLVETLLPGQLLAVEMPATQGQCYGAIYQVQGQALTTLTADQLWQPPAWQNHLAQYGPELVLKTVPEGLGVTAPHLLQLAHWAWHRGVAPDWSLALPFYGN
ncbi:tRNA (adenosine(37)-N6)-threonylcarbamoyltransferase complex dimerization subunit type 1 TsaB [Synechocystis sp. LKSZ1]|uniref:tRNA (adenosine(37)-N6)-threonylcarbamoyltransferase complex dimerization subunit type 1 TsaB n=1 Tax=Synechocystis sp. LKSZ1 TaxID=3144951 RepID=UPI00336BD339